MLEQFNELCKQRHSIRKFKQKPIDDNTINQILETVQTAPSAGNLQAYEVVLVKDEHKRKELSNASYAQNFVSKAPIVLVFNALPHESSQKYGNRGENLYSIQDATIACTYAMLAATASGLSSTWVGAFDENKIKNILQVSPTTKPVALLPIGYAAEEPKITPRKTLYEISKEL